MISQENIENIAMSDEITSLNAIPANTLECVCKTIHFNTKPISDIVSNIFFKLSELRINDDVRITVKNKISEKKVDYMFLYLFFLIFNFFFS
jgi:hypothetical protein